MQVPGAACIVQQHAAGRALLIAAMAEDQPVEEDHVGLVPMRGEEVSYATMLAEHQELVDIEEDEPVDFPNPVFQEVLVHLRLQADEGIVHERHERFGTGKEGQHLLVAGGGVVVVAIEIDVIEADAAVIEQPLGDILALPAGAGDDRVLVMLRHRLARCAPSRSRAGGAPARRRRCGRSCRVRHSGVASRSPGGSAPRKRPARPGRRGGAARLPTGR